MDADQPLRPTSLHEEVAARLRGMVFDRQLEPGAWIDEMALVERWHISRTPLREALKVLASEGLVTLVPRRGCQVVEMSEEDSAELFPVMAMLEGRCAYEAAQKATSGEIAELQALHDTLERHAAAGDIDGYYRANHLFHSRVQAIAANRWLDRTTGDLRRFIRLLRGRQLHHEGRLEESIAEHRALIRAFAARDADGAQRVMHAHLMAQLAALQAMRRAEATRPTPAESPADAR